MFKTLETKAQQIEMGTSTLRHKLPDVINNYFPSNNAQNINKILDKKFAQLDANNFTDGKDFLAKNEAFQTLLTECETINEEIKSELKMLTVELNISFETASSSLLENSAEQNTPTSSIVSPSIGGSDNDNKENSNSDYDGNIDIYRGNAVPSTPAIQSQKKHSKSRVDYLKRNF